MDSKHRWPPHRNSVFLPTSCLAKFKEFPTIFCHPPNLKGFCFSETGWFMAGVGEETGRRWATLSDKSPIEIRMHSSAQPGSVKHWLLGFLFLAVCGGLCRVGIVGDSSTRLLVYGSRSLMLHFLRSTHPSLSKGRPRQTQLAFFSAELTLVQNKLWINIELRAVWQAGAGIQERAGGGAATATQSPGVAISAGHLAGDFHGLGPSVVPGGAGVGGDVQAGTLAGVGAAAGALAGVGAASGALAGVGAAAGALQRGGTGA